MRREDWLPVVVAGTAAAAVCYVAYNQAANAAKEYDDQERQAAAAKADLEAKIAAKGPSPKISARLRASSPSKDAAGSNATTASAPAGASNANGSIGAIPASDADPSTSDSDSTPKQCDFCHKVPEKDDPIHRCSRCRQAWYCNQTCQRQAWPSHKRECNKRAGHSSSGSSSTATSPTAQQVSSRRSSNPGAADAADARAAENASMMEVLKNYLQQHSASQTEPLQQQFEQAVLLYVRQEHRTAVAQLQAVHRAAEQQGQLSLAGDACKWMGHAYAKLGDAGKAAAAFANGCELAVRSGSKKLQVDCLSGMGSMYRDIGQLKPAEGFLRQALRVADSLGDSVVRAGCLTHLGSVLIASDADSAIKHLEEAVQLREDQVVSLHEEGKRGSLLATAIMEHAGSLVSLAGAYYVQQRYSDAADAYTKSLTVFEMIDDTEKVCKCLVNLANLYELQMQLPDARTTAAEHRKRLYSISSQQLDREVPETCSICCEAISPLQPTAGDEQKLLLLGCLHCFHHNCWESWSEKQSTCPSCKQPMPLVQQR